MKAWKNTGRIGIGMDFGHGEASRPMGEAAIAEGRIYLQFDPGLVAAGVNPWPIRLKLHTGLQEGHLDAEDRHDDHRDDTVCRCHGHAWLTAPR